MLEKKEKVLLKKVDAEVEKAKEYTRAKNKRGKHLCLIVEFLVFILDNFANLSLYHILCQILQINIKE